MSLQEVPELRLHAQGIFTKGRVDDRGLGDVDHVESVGAGLEVEERVHRGPRSDQIGKRSKGCYFSFLPEGASSGVVDRAIEQGVCRTILSHDLDTVEFKEAVEVPRSEELSSVQEIAIGVNLSGFKEEVLLNIAIFNLKFSSEVNIDYRFHVHRIIEL